MTEHEWLASSDPQAMLQHLQTGAIAFRHRPGGFPASYPAPLLVATDRKLRLFACACRRRVPNLEWRGQSQGWADMEQYPERKILANGIGPHAIPAIEHARLFSKRQANNPSQSEMAHLLRDIFGNPWRPITIQLHWLTPTVKALAQAAYDLRLGSVCPTCHTWGIDTVHDERTGRTDHVTCPTCHGYGYLDDGNITRGWLNPVRLAVLSDALMEAGCDCEEILSHLRIQSHVWGCWVVDLLLGNK